MRFTISIFAILASIITVSESAEVTEEFANAMSIQKRELAILECIWCVTGPSPPRGRCQEYDCGGSSGVHYYTCCNFGRNLEDAIEYDGASDGNYCGLDGTNIGGGCANGSSFQCRGADGATQCKDWCDHNAITFPGTCWNWSDCFKRCCADSNGPVRGVNGWIPVRVCTEKRRAEEHKNLRNLRKLYYDEPSCMCHEGWVPVDAQCSVPIDDTCGGISPVVEVTSTEYDPDYANYDESDYDYYNHPYDAYDGMMSMDYGTP